MIRTAVPAGRMAGLPLGISIASQSRVRVMGAVGVITHLEIA
jgi:hypothetical protein